jgi:hypothetical protein
MPFKQNPIITRERLSVVVPVVIYFFRDVAIRKGGAYKIPSLLIEGKPFA